MVRANLETDAGKPGPVPPYRSFEERGPVYVYKRWCKGCGVCIAFCPRQVLEMGQDGHSFVAHSERCTQCRVCEYLCPDFAITVAKREKIRKE
jgi:2-oxoglutarate ferredoxin oxidoreductase subunit delta